MAKKPKQDKKTVKTSGKKSVPKAAAAPKKPEGTPVHVQVEAVPVNETPPTPALETPATESTSATPPPNGPTIVKKQPTKGQRPTKLWVILVIAGFVLIGGATWAGLEIFGPREQVGIQNSNSNTNTSVAGAYRKLDGVLVEEGKENPNLYAVMIENLTDSRPPSSLDKAGVVYEALAEGGITRFMAMFPVSEDIVEIGPVRSARRYFIAWADEYNKPLYVHAGGSPNALSYLSSSQSNVLDFNQFFHAPNFWRDSTRFAPHNLYTSSDKLFLGLKDIAPDLVPNYESWPFKEEADLTQRTAPTAAEIVINYSSFNYRATFRYHPQLNRYFRFQGDSDHVTRDGQKIQPTNVIVMFVETGLLPGESQRLQMTTEGQGRALVFRDGGVVEGTWKKDSSQTRTQFLDANNQPIELNRGQVWISVVPTDRDVTYSAPEAETTN